MEAPCNLVRLALGPRRRSVGRKVAGGSYESDGRCRRAEPKLVVLKCRFDDLNRVKVAVLAQQSPPQGGHELVRLDSLMEAVHDERPSLVDPLLMIEQVIEIAQPRLGTPARDTAFGNGNGRCVG